MEIKTYKKFFEDGDGGGVAMANATTAGMGAIVSAQPGALPGTTGTEGSGDLGFTFKKEKREKGDPSEVSDLRDLEEDDSSVVNVKEKIKTFSEHLRNFNESNIVIGGGFSPIIGYKSDLENDKVSLMDGYQTGTVYIGDESVETKKSVDYSSPFHTGQVIGDGVEDCEEMDFSYSRSIDSNVVEDLLRKHVEENYDGKIIKIVYH